MRPDAYGNLFFSDGLQNVVSGLGTARDKRSSNQFTYSTIDRQNLFELEAAYSTNWLARAVVDYPVDDATREWRYFSCEEASDIQRGEKRYRVQQHVQEGFKWARLYGGAVIVMVTDQDMSQPLDITRIGRGGLKRLVTIDRKYITGVDYNYTDPTAPNYLLPNYYMVYGGSLRIHHSHIVRIPGERVPLSIRQVNGGWDDSALRKCLEDIKDAVSSKAGIASLIQEANVDVIQREGLSDELSTEDGSSAIIKRYQLAGTLKAINRMLLLDGDETYERRAASFGGLGEILHRLMEWVSGAADIPMTRLFGIQSKGIGDSGAGDEKNYLNAIRGKQESDYRDVLEQIDEVMIRSTLGDMPEECEFEFNPLSQPSGTEQAQQDLARSQADGNYLADGVLLRSQIAQRLQSVGSYPIDDAHIEELKRQETEEVEGMFELPEIEPPVLQAKDAQFREEDHPRDKDGKFTTAGGGSGAKIPSDLYGHLREKEDQGGEAAVIEEAQRLANDNPDKIGQIRSEVSDLGYSASKIQEPSAPAVEAGTPSWEETPEELAVERASSDPADYQGADEVLESSNLKPVNEITDQEKFDSIRESLLSEGWKGRPLVYFNEAGANQAVTGSHRIHAAMSISPEFPVPVVEIPQEALDLEDEKGFTVLDLVGKDEDKRMALILRAGGYESIADILDHENEDR
jgi:hypothetical protein